MQLKLAKLELMSKLSYYTWRVIRYIRKISWNFAKKYAINILSGAQETFEALSHIENLESIMILGFLFLLLFRFYG